MYAIRSYYVYTTVEAVKSKIKTKYSKKGKGRIYTSKSIWAKVLVFMACPLPVYFGSIIAKSQNSLYLDDAIAGGLFWCGVLLALFIGLDQITARAKSMKKSAKITLGIIFWLLFVAFFFISVAIIGESKGTYQLSFAASGATFISALFAMFMEKSYNFV